MVGHILSIGFQANPFTCAQSVEHQFSLFIFISVAVAFLGRGEDWTQYWLHPPRTTASPRHERPVYVGVHSLVPPAARLFASRLAVYLGTDLPVSILIWRVKLLLIWSA